MTHPSTNACMKQPNETHSVLSSLLSPILESRHARWAFSFTMQGTALRLGLAHVAGVYQNFAVS